MVRRFSPLDQIFPPQSDGFDDEGGGGGASGVGSDGVTREIVKGGLDRNIWNLLTFK